MYIYIYIYIIPAFIYLTLCNDTSNNNDSLHNIYIYIFISQILTAVRRCVTSCFWRSLASCGPHLLAECQSFDGHVIQGYWSRALRHAFGVRGVSGPHVLDYVDHLKKKKRQNHEEYLGSEKVAPMRSQI